MLIKRIWVAILFILMITGLSVIGFFTMSQLACEGQAINFRIAPSQEQQIWGERIIGQSFVAPRNGLHRIDLLFETYQRQNNREVNLHLLELTPNSSNPFQNPIIVDLTFNAALVQDRSWHTFTFPPISNSAGKHYLLALHSPKSFPGNAISVGGIEWDVYAPGSAFLGPVPVLADVAFRTCYQMTTLEKWQIFARQITDNRPLVWGNTLFYGSIVIIYALLLIGLFWKLTRSVFS